jgi:acyl transferase domain-containing protein
MEWGITPQALIGEGLGEYVAACLAGVFSLEVAVGLVAEGQLVQRERLNAPQIPCVSGATASWISDDDATNPDYWAKSVGRGHSFAERVSVLLKEPEQVLLEIGSGQALSAQVLAHPNKAERQIVLAGLPALSDQRPDDAGLLATLRRLWLAGVSVDWYGFHAHERRQRLPLPTYPFERKRYWIAPYKPADHAVIAVDQPATLAKKPDIADWFYLPGWKTAPPPLAARLGQGQGSWLLCVDEQGIGAALAERLRQANQPIVTVVAGRSFSRRADDAYTLDLRRRADYTALFNALAATGNLPRRIIHLWSIADEQRDHADREHFKRAQDRGFWSLLFLAQALAEHSSTDAVQLWVVSNQAQKVESADQVDPQQATILGVCKVIPQENAQASCHHIDIALSGQGSRSADALSGQLLNEIVANLPETIIAYRGQQRWLQCFEPLRLADAGEPIRPLREQGVYLFTSGLSDISLALAEHLAHTVRARLVVVEGESFPKRAAWDQCLKHDGQASVSLKIKSLKALEALGAQLLIINADRADAAHLRDALAQTLAHFGELHGIVHAVGDIGDRTFATIQDTDAGDGIWRFEPRMHGLYALQELLADHTLDFCMLVSSLAAVLGGVGQAAYAAANQFIDSFAASQGRPWLSVNWDAWQFEAEQPRIAALTPRLAQFAITPVEGGQAFERILSFCTSNQIIVSTGDLQARLKRWLGNESAQDQRAIPHARHARPNLLTPYVAPTTDLERTLAEVWQATLGIEKVGIDDNFFDFGGDSLIAVKTITRLEKTLQRKVPAANLYQTPSIRALAALLAEDEAESAQQRAEQLDERRETLSRRNQYLHQRLKGRG